VRALAIRRRPGYQRPVPEVSVVLAVHDQARWIGETIASVRAQTFTDWELVVVDDGSTDGTADVVAGVADARVRLLRQPRAERAAARNRGVAATTAPLVAFLDGDDLWRPEKLARQVAALRAAPAAGLCYTVARFVDAGGRPLPLRKPPRGIVGPLFPGLLRGNAIILASVVVRRTALDAVGGFDETLPAFGCEDWDLWLRIARRHPAIAIDDELTLYRQHSGNTARGVVLASALAVIDRRWADPETARVAGISRAEARALHYWMNAAWTERRADALALAAHALRESPPTVFSRSGLATLAALVLPAAAVRALRRVA
jgi:glycosyltransferase involved in cell wall biosynthesis